MLSVVNEAFKKVVMFLCTPFANRCLDSSPARLDGIHPVQTPLIWIRESPDHRSVRTQGVLRI